MKQLLLIFTMCLSYIIQAQTSSSGSVKGKITDQSTREELPYVNVVVKDSTNHIITGGITNQKGNFEIKQIPFGKHSIEFQFIGYKTEVRKIQVSSKNLKQDLGEIKILVESDLMDEVTLVTEVSTVEQKVDRKVINVGKDLTSAGTTASEMLNNVQSVSVDQQTGNISLRGNENVRVLVDGKPSNISANQLLKQIPSSSIKQIELITNPSAKYNPEGMSGMINIILHKNMNQGFNANVNSGITYGENARFNGALNMNYKMGKVNFYSNYGYNVGKSHNFGHVTRTAGIPSLQEFVFDNDPESHLIKLGADFYLNKRNTLSVYTTQNFNDSYNDGVTKVTIQDVIVTNSPNDASIETTSGVYNLNYRLALNEKGDHNLEFEANYSESSNPENANYYDLINPNNGNLNFTNRVKNDRENTLINLDYTKPLDEHSKLELGGEIRLDKTTNQNLTTQTNVDNSAFTYDRNIYSGYFTYSRSFDKLTMLVGSRFEQYSVDGKFNRATENQGYTDEIFSIYPSAFFTYTPSKKNQFQFSYSRRVDRPSIGQVNPIREWATPLITSIGNPDLLPQFTNSFEVNYSKQLEKGGITIGTFYRRINNTISRFSTIDPLDPNRQLLSYANFDGTNRYGIELSTYYNVKKWWRLNGSVELYSKTDQTETREVQANSLSARISNTITASKRLSFQVFAMINAPENGIQFERKTMWMLNIGSSYTILDGKGTISLRVNDIFNGMRFKFDSIEPYEQNGQFKWESRTVYLGFNYRFGKGKNRALQRKRRDNNEVRSSGGFS